MKIVIATPELWFSERDLICSFLIGCLRKRSLAMKTADFEFVAKRGLTMMDIQSADCSSLERATINDCVSRLSYVANNSALNTTGKNTFLDDLKKFSSDDKHEIEEFEKCFKIWFNELDAAHGGPSKD